MPADDLEELVNQKLENLRPKLLDLSRRNPLISTKLSPRSNSHIRVVDELPEILFYKLNNGQEMRLVPLPDIDDDPRDERTSEFRDALINARLTDDQYLADMEAIDRDADDYLGRARTVERALKDRIRPSLNLPERVKRAEVNLIEHAKINGITPSYELPTPAEEHADGRHTDNDIQTLLLPDDLERKLNAVLSKSRSWLQETGMNVLQIVYGFLEWSDGPQTETSFAPLVLCEVEITKQRTTQGAQFSISRIGGDPEINAVLAEKLRLDFALELPSFAGSSVETYFAEIAALSPHNMTWRVRRQIAIGVFPSARMAMYLDLDPKQPNFPKSEIVRSLLAGSSSGASSPFADEYEVDEPAIERKVPFLVLDADSSQFSTLVDVADGKNVAVEGPPGTGKSQTIVNAIAAALASGKKVLFVAEKLAALNVVKSRLEAVKLGEFLLPLQAEKSTREQVVQSIRDRVRMSPGPSVRDLESKLAELRKVREQLADYIRLIGRTFQNTGLTVREVLGKALATNIYLADFSQETLAKCEVPESFLTASGLLQLRRTGSQIAQAYRDAVNAKANWKGTKLLHPERFTIEEACAAASRASTAFAHLAIARDQLAGTFLPTELPRAELSDINVHIEAAQKHLQSHPAEILVALLQAGNAQSVQDFIYRCDACQAAREELARVLSVQSTAQCLDSIGQVAELCQRFNLPTIDINELGDQLHARRQFVETARSISSLLKPLTEVRPESRNWRLVDLAKAQTLLNEAGRAALLSRNARTAEPDGALLLQRLCTEGRELQTLKAELDKHITFNVEVSVAALSECVSTLRAAGTFRAFSGRYRKAKRVASSVTRMNKFNGRDAIDALDDLIAFKKREAEYSQNPHVLAAFGFHFRGVDTAFDQFERLAAYYRGVGTQFGQPDARPLRIFLHKADWEELELVPPLPPMDDPTTTHDTLRERIAANETQVRSLEDAIENLRSCVFVFADPKSIDVAELPYLVSRTRSLIDEENALNEKENIREIIQGNFNGSRTETDGLIGLVRWAKAARVFESIISNILNAGAASEACRRIDAVLGAERLAEQSLAAVTDIAKIAPEHFARQNSCHETARRLGEAAEDPDGLSLHAVLATMLEEARPQGLLPLTEDRLDSGADLVGLDDQFEALATRQ